LARKPRYRLNPNRIRDDSVTNAADNDLTLAETSQLSIPAGSTLTVEQLLSDFPLQYVTGQAQAQA
jgi:hypothetical protein